MKHTQELFEMDIELQLEQVQIEQKTDADKLDDVMKKLPSYIKKRKKIK